MAQSNECFIGFRYSARLLYAQRFNATEMMISGVALVEGGKGAGDYFLGGGEGVQEG